MQSMGEFQLERPLGRGATAQVYLATRKSDGTRVALKVFHPGLWDQGDLRRRAMTEFATIGGLQHPGIVRVLEALWDQDPPAVALEYVDGSSLEELQPRLPYILPEVAVAIVCEVLEALEFAHARGVIHRDLKPANILIGSDGRVLISDFGLARVADVSRVTVTGTILGSPDYMSPEQARGDLARVESDLFSVAAILYFLVTGTRPFSRHSPLATLAAVVDAEAEHPCRRNPKLSPELATLIQRGLSKRPEDRFRTAAELRGALRAYLSGVGLGGGDFTFKEWLARPTETALDAMKSISRALIERCEHALARGELENALGALSHLSLVAPESGAVPRLLEEAERARRSARRKPWLWASGAALLLLAVGAALWLRQAQPTAATVAAKQDSVRATQAAPEPARSARPASPAPARPARSRVKLDIPDGVQVSWDGKRIDAKQGLPPQSPGEHSIILEKRGSRPIVRTVIVKAGEPTVIRVR